MGIPEGTVLARASRERWTPRIEAAKSMAKPLESAIVPACDAAALTMRERAERHVARLEYVTEKVLPDLGSMQPAELLDGTRKLNDSILCAAQLRIGESAVTGGMINLAILTNQAAVQFVGHRRRSWRPRNNNTSRFSKTESQGLSRRNNDVAVRGQCLG